MSTSTFRFAPDILRRLGEELNPHPAFGLIELVKNAYDADARECHVRLDRIDADGGSVEVIDDGDGMTVDQIKGGWLVIGRSEKERRSRTRLGRIPVGSKGLGRLAALRLGYFASLETRPRTNGHAYALGIDWNRFDAASLIEEVDLEIKRLPPSSRANVGTTIKLAGLRDRIGRSEVKRLARAMLLLADPFGDNAHGFQPRLSAEEFVDLEKLVSRRYFDQATFHLIAKLDKQGKASARLLDFRGETLFTASHGDLVGKGEHGFECPPLEFDFWTFLLNRSTFANLTVTIHEVRDWLTEFGGVHIYHNGIRVSPYGDPGHDWLSMNLSRVRSPEERPSTNNSIGRVRINDPNQTLLQKTDRSGFIETELFDEVRRFAREALEWMAVRRLELAEKRRLAARTQAPKATDKSKRSLDKVISAAPPKLRQQLQQAAATYDRSRDKEVNELKKEVQLYRTLSTAGITAATFAHESTGNPLKVIQASLSTIERRAKDLLGDDYTRSIKAAVDRIQASINGLAVLDATTLSLLENDKRRPSKVDVHKVVESLVQAFQPFFSIRHVSVETELAEGSPYLLGSEAAVESVVTNLINNSLVALENKGQSNRRLLIRTAVSETTLRLAVLDSGDGIRDIRLSEIWLPGKTTRKNGTGLGLTIVRDTVSDLGGNVGAIESSSLGGAEVYVELPIIGA